MSQEPNGKVSEKMPDSEVIAKAKHSLGLYQRVWLSVFQNLLREILS